MVVFRKYVCIVYRRNPHLLCHLFSHQNTIGATRKNCNYDTFLLENEWPGNSGFFRKWSSFTQARKMSWWYIQTYEKVLGEGVSVHFLFCCQMCSTFQASTPQNDQNCWNFLFLEGNFENQRESEFWLTSRSLNTLRAKKNPSPKWIYCWILGI